MIPEMTAPTSDELLQAALEYARDGWPVVPLHTPINGICDCSKQDACKTPGKHPWTKNGLTDATTNELKIRGWWRDRPIANIGLTVKPGYAIVDVDGEHGQKRMAEAEWHLTATAVQSSGRGAHYVYRVRNRVHPRILIKESADNTHDGVDLRGPGSYIVAAPSLHASGRVYEWAVPLSQTEIAPPWLEDVALQPGGSEIGEHLPVDFTRLLDGLSEGSRKLEIYRAASKLRGADVPIDLAVMLARQAAANCTPPLEAREAERKVREAYAKYPPNASAQDLPAGVTLLSHDSVMVDFETCRFVFSDLEKAGRELHAEMEVKSLLPGTPQEPYVQRLNLLSMSARDQARREIEHVLGNPVKGQWTALFSRAITKAQDAYLSVDRSISTSDIVAPDTLKFVIPDICVEDGFSILFGAGSAGKTWLLMKMALAVSRGEPFLGRSTEQRNVLYIDFETGESTYGYRMRRICAGEGLGLEGARHVRFWNGKGLAFEDQVEAIKRCCEERQIGFICLDHIAAACTGDANEQSVATRFARTVGKIGLPMMALAHITGAAVRDPEQADKPFGCHSADTEILTRRGWITHDQWQAGEQIMGYDPISQRLCWTRPAVLHAYPYEGDMLRFDLGSSEALVTPNHRMYVKPNWPARPDAVERRPRFKSEWQVVPARQLKTSKWLLPHATAMHDDEEGREPDFFMADQPYLSFEFMRLLGWWIAEGCFQDRALGLSQKEGPLAHLMCETLDELSIEYWTASRKWMESTRPAEVEVRRIRTKNSGPLADWMRTNAGHGALTKKIPEAVWGLSTNLKTTLLEALIDGDGHRKPTGTRTYATISPQLADDVMRLAIETGHSASIRKDAPGRKGCHDRYEVKIGRQERTTVVLRAERHITPQPYDGMVYCFTVATDAYLTRRNGKPFISGNSIFWENLSRRTIFVLRQQESESVIADLGLYPKKINDGGRPSPFGARITFEDPSGPISVDPDGLANKGVLSSVRGLHHVIWDMLAAPMLAEEIAEATDKSERHVKDMMKAHPRLFVELKAGGRGVKSTWGRAEVRAPYNDPPDGYSFDEDETDVPF